MRRAQTVCCGRWLWASMWLTRLWASLKMRAELEFLCLRNCWMPLNRWKLKLNKSKKKRGKTNTYLSFLFSWLVRVGVYPYFPITFIYRETPYIENIGKSLINKYIGNFSIWKDPLHCRIHDAVLLFRHIHPSWTTTGSCPPLPQLFRRRVLDVLLQIVLDQPHLRLKIPTNLF